MRHLPPPALAVFCLIGAAAVACLPEERSADLRVELDPIPPLLLRDSVRLAARVVTADGTPVPDARVVYASSDSAVLTVTAEGLLRAVGVGRATLSVKAQSFEDAVPVVRELQVRGPLEVDSVVPQLVGFGTKITIYGVGLEPDSLFSITLGGADVPVDSSSYVPADPARPEGIGSLQIWAAPPAPERAALTVLGFKGGLVFPDTLRVLQRDIFEPNDTAARDLGTLDGSNAVLYNPGLAFESRRRDEGQPAVDWYRWSNAIQRNRTLIVIGENVGAKTFNVFVTDSLEWDGSFKEFFVGPQSWTIGPQTYLCWGLTMTSFGEAVQPLELEFPFAWIALGDLPVGTYHVLVSYAVPPTPQRYQLVVWNGYLSPKQKDVAEENDYCDQAADLGLAAGPTGVDLTIDTPHDVDWFRFTVPAPGQLVTLTTTSSDTLLDVDLYLMADHRPDSLPLVATATAFGSDERLGPLALTPGDYFLLVVDYPGQVGPYTLKATFGALPVGAPAPASLGPTRDMRAAFQRKARALVETARPRPRPRP